MTVKLLTEQHLKFLSLKGAATCSSESILVKMPHCGKSHVVAQMFSALAYSTIFVLKILSAFHISCIYSCALQTRFFHGFSKQIGPRSDCSLVQKQTRAADNKSCDLREKGYCYNYMV